ncbi:hypothetical protein SBV1_3470003 [Verrucomicrobia bacterium]|nr:hypothetical protein SBV1_3470003 [Verrucomicrobiota bacterium]
MSGRQKLRLFGMVARVQVTLLRKKNFGGRSTTGRMNSLRPDKHKLAFMAYPGGARSAASSSCLLIAPQNSQPLGGT